MNLDLLRTLPKPSLRPFFAQRVTALATARPIRVRRAPLLMWAYWLALVFVVTALIGVTTGSVAVLVGVAGLAAQS